MKKEDQYPLTNDELFDLAKDMRKQKQDPHIYRHNAIIELKELKKQSYEREQADFATKQAEERSEIEETRKQLQEAQEKLNASK